ncbi:hypothetical protein TELCIR_19820 [Teladorsagia circumcincta]|uniref:Uncharacterized protein n=1 Tax=Teladorsagia circumcincta TaxID=45464 RepID=A0A2G9TLB3_TELCI|nr:hypothetical protein TELCIR_19820 [Teladorsagia circumcincta]
MRQFVASALDRRSSISIHVKKNNPRQPFTPRKPVPERSTGKPPMDSRITPPLPFTPRKPFTVGPTRRPTQEYLVTVSPMLCFLIAKIIREL